MRYLFSLLTLILLVASPVLAQNWTLNAFLKHDSDIEGVAFSEDGRTLASIGADRVLHYWDPHKEKSQPHAEISAIDRWSIDASVVPEEPHTLPINTFAILRQAVSFPGVENPSALLATGSSDQTIYLQGFPSLRPLFQIQEQGEVWAVALSPDGRTLASGGDFAGIHLWDLTTISPTRGTIELKSTLTASTARVEGLAFSPDGQTLAVATGRTDGEAIHLWDLRTEQLKETLIAVGVPIKKVAFSPDGQMIVGGAEHTFGGRNVLLWKRRPLSPAKIPHSVEIAGPSTVRALAKDFTYTVTVKNVYGHGIENVLVRLDNPPTGVWTDNQGNGAWTDNQGNAVFFLQFRAVGMHDINVKVLQRASRAVTLENLFERRAEVPKPTSITPVEATLDYILIHGSDTQGYYYDTFKVTDATGQPLENFVVNSFVYPYGTSPSSAFTVDASTDSQGEATLTTMISQGAYDVKAEVYALVNTKPWLDVTFPNRVTAIQHKTVNEYGSTVYTYADGNTTILIKGLTLEGISDDYEDDYTKFFPPADGDHFDLYNQGAPQNRFFDLLTVGGSSNGCGITSAMMVLNYYGVNVKPRSESISPEYRPETLPQGWNEEYFVQRSLHNYVAKNGEIVTIQWGVYPSEIRLALRRLLHSAHEPIQRFSGTRQNLIDVVTESRPPIILFEVQAPSGWHYVVVVGYDTRNDSFLIADPNNFFKWLPWSWPGDEVRHIKAGYGTTPVKDPDTGKDPLTHSLQNMWGHFVDDQKGFAFIESDRWLRGLGGLIGEPFDQYEMIVPSKAPQFHHLESETFRIEIYGNTSNVFKVFKYDTKSKTVPLNRDVHHWTANWELGTRSRNTAVNLSGIVYNDDNRIRVTTEVKRGIEAVDDEQDIIYRQHPLIKNTIGQVIKTVFSMATGYEDVYVTVYYDPDAPAAPVDPVLAAVPLQGNALLPNYPNPFNPETWIPYQLAKPSEVTLYIHGVDGKLVRKLALGHQNAGAYYSKGRAAYWDGRNAFGERVASGLYFYTLITDDFHATGKMLILK